jgi:hypothetical protein
MIGAESAPLLPSSNLTVRQEKIQKLIDMQRQQQQSLHAHLSMDLNALTDATCHPHPPVNVDAATFFNNKETTKLAHVSSYQSLSDYNRDSSTRSSPDARRDKDSSISIDETYLHAPPQSQYWSAQETVQRQAPVTLRHTPCVPCSFSCTDNVLKSFCFGAIDGMLTGSGITAACAGLGILTPRTTSSILNSFNSTSLYDLFIQNTPPSHLLVLALCIAACSSDAICIAIGHIWSTRVHLHTHKRRQTDELQSFYYFHNDSKARLATSLISRGMLKIDAITIVDVLSGYPDMFVNALVSDTQAVGSSIFGSVNTTSAAVETDESKRNDRNTINVPVPYTINNSFTDQQYPYLNKSPHLAPVDRNITHEPAYGSIHHDSVPSLPSHWKPQAHGQYGSEPVIIHPSLTESNRGPYYYSDSHLYHAHPPSYDHPIHNNYHFVGHEHKADEEIPVESSLIHRAVRDSWMEGLCIMFSFSIFAILPCILYVMIDVFFHTIQGEESTEKTSTGYIYQDYISPSSMTLIITSLIMVLLGVWKR